MCSRPVLLLGKYNSRFRPLWHRLRPVLLLEPDTDRSVAAWYGGTGLVCRMLGCNREDTVQVGESGCARIVKVGG